VNEIRQHRVAVADGVELEVTEAGQAGNPLVVLCHGFPECAYSWRHQIQPLADAGFHVVAPDQRGYGHSSAPSDVAAYGAQHLTADVAALLDEAGADQAVIVGHDWGALVAWHMAQLHPERVRAVIGVSVPYTVWPAPPTELLKSIWGDRFFYILYFQEVGPAERELGADIRRTMHTTLWAGSGVMHRDEATDTLPAEGTGFLDAMAHGVGPVPDELPDWLTADDLDTYVERFTASGFFGPLSWYRNLDANYELTKDIPASTVAMPSYFIAGRNDMVIAGRPGYIEAMEAALPNYRGATLIDGAGHWTQQEAVDEFNDALLGFLRTLP
jgi:pimeloyl-ACP methyl ester carboxylesterase